MYSLQKILLIRVKNLYLYLVKQVVLRGVSIKCYIDQYAGIEKKAL